MRRLTRDKPGADTDIDHTHAVRKTRTAQRAAPIP
jgi:hypothetical protein